MGCMCFDLFSHGRQGGAIAPNIAMSGNVHIARCLHKTEQINTKLAKNWPNASSPRPSIGTTLQASRVDVVPILNTPLLIKVITSQ